MYTLKKILEKVSSPNKAESESALGHAIKHMEYNKVSLNEVAGIEFYGKDIVMPQLIIALSRKFATQREREGFVNRKFNKYIVENKNHSQLERVKDQQITSLKKEIGDLKGKICHLNEMEESKDKHVAQQIIQAHSRIETLMQENATLSLLNFKLEQKLNQTLVRGKRYKLKQVEPREKYNVTVTIDPYSQVEVSRTLELRRSSIWKF